MDREDVRKEGEKGFSLGLWVGLRLIEGSEEKLDVEGTQRGEVCTRTQGHEYVGVEGKDRILMNSIEMVGNLQILTSYRVTSPS